MSNPPTPISRTKRRALSAIFALFGCSTASTSSKPIETSGPQVPPAACLDANPNAGDAGNATVRCASPADCPQGFRCNGNLGPPLCERLFCGPQHSICETTDVCQEGLECYDGECTLCNVCGDKCAVDFANDPNNCGECRKKVPKGSLCVEGKMACKAPLIQCDGACVDPSSDSKNCGSCGNAATTDKTSCKNGKLTCIGKWTSCNGTCVDLTADDANCTACGKACSAPWTCTAEGPGGCIAIATVPDRVPCNDICAKGGAVCIYDTKHSYANYKDVYYQYMQPCDATPPPTISTSIGELNFLQQNCTCVKPAE